MPTRESLNDISVQDMSAYLGEMPPDGTDIVGTDTVDYTYEEVAKDLYFLTVRYPDLVKVRVCGESVDKRAIYEVVLGNEASENHIEIHYAMHSREYINTLLAMRQIEEYAKNAAGGGTYNGASIRDLFANVCIHLLPMANPDGEMVSMGGLETLRLQSLRDIVHWCWESDTLLGRTAADLDTYLRTFKANAHGCDLNKNFDAGWAEYSDGVPVPSTDCYKGTGAASEPETQAILKVAHENPTRCVIAYHSAGNMIYWNYEVEDELLLNADRDLAAGLSEVTGYATAVAAKYNTHLAGGCSDYFMWTAGIPAVTVETGQGTCPLTIYEFPAIWESNKNVLYRLAEMYGG
jgi:g-D-glutamyl-meso-diaminopimelate peptidase